MNLVVASPWRIDGCLDEYCNRVLVLGKKVEHCLFGKMVNHCGDHCRVRKLDQLVMEQRYRSPRIFFVFQLKEEAAFHKFRW